MENEKKLLFEGLAHLKLKWIVEFSEASLCLPWLPTRRSTAMAERDMVLERFFHKYSVAVLLSDYSGELECLTLQSLIDLQKIYDDLQLGEWTILFRHNGELLLNEILVDGMLMSMDLPELLSATRADCLIFSHPDDIEWSILFSKQA